MPVKTLIATTIDEKGKPTKGKHLGDRYYWTDDVRDKVTNALTGQHSGECVLVRQSPGGFGMWLCEAGWTFAEGNLTAGGLLDYDAPGPTFTVPIFGGTSTYKDARGQITGDASHANDTPPTYEYTLEILP
jgi:hypothetical protein